MAIGAQKWQSKHYPNKGGNVKMGETTGFKLTTGQKNVLQVWLALCETCNRCTSR
jgi:hypothetical protein